MPLSDNHFRDRVELKARNAIDVYLYERERDVRWASSVRRYGEDAAREYGDRFLVELIQNAYDANPRGSTGGKVAVALDLGEDEHGVLYVANTGLPFSDNNFDAITDIAQSDKPPGEGIGNKGVGFKSVLQVSDVPEVYSTQPGSTNERFAGYRFRLPSPADVARMVEPDVLDDVLRDVPPYALPCPIDTIPERLDEFLATGFCTVIRLPLSSEKAAERAESEIHNLAASSTPMLLFLDRIALLTLVVDEADGTRTVDKELHRKTSSIGGKASSESVAVEEVDLGDQGTFVVATRTVLGAALNDAILKSAPEIDPKWASWKQDSTVSVACRLDHDEDEWRFYTFLPMDGSAAPFNAHANAPFFTKLDRTSVRFGVAFNSFLLDEIAALCVAAAVWIRDNVLEYSALCLDLICWDSSELQRLQDAFDETGQSLEEARLVPLLKDQGDVQAFGSVAGARIWGPFDESILMVTAERLSSDTDAEIIDPVLADRIERFSQLRLDLSHHQDDGGPTDEEWATWLEIIAKRLRRSELSASGHVWMDFYDDIATIYAALDTDVLHGRRLIIDDNNRLRPCGTPPDGSRARTVFFAPVRDQTEGEEEVDAAFDIKPPPELSKSVAFTRADLDWYTADATKRNARRCRHFLEQAGLVRRYRTNDVLAAVGRFVSSNRDKPNSEKAFEVALTFAYRLKDRATDAALRDAGLYVPTRRGWSPAVEASFSDGWNTTNGPLLAELVQLTGSVSSELDAIGDQLLEAPDKWLTTDASVDGWTQFLRRLGVHDGMIPLNRADKAFQAQGALFTCEAWARAAGFPDEFAADWLSQIDNPRPFAGYPQTDCRSISELWSLPGQFEFSQFPEEVQARYAEVLIHSLTAWSKDVLTVRMRRANHPQDYPTQWPTPVSVFLRCAPWVPVTAGGIRKIRPPERSWYFDDDKGETLPGFAPLLPFPLRRIIRGDSVLRERVRQWCGIRCWNDERDATALVRSLTELLGTEFVGPADLPTFAKEYERALHRSLAQGANPWPTDNAPEVLIRNGERLESRALEDGGEHVYIASENDGGTRRLLAELGAPIVCGYPSDSSKIAAVLSERAGKTVRLITDAEVTVLADGVAITDSTRGVALIGLERRWLVELVVAAIDQLGSRFRRLSDRSLRDSATQLAAVELVPAEQLTLSVDGHPPADSTDHRGVFLVPGAVRPLIVLSEFDNEVDWDTLERVTHQIAVVARAPEIGSTLFEAIVRLRRTQRDDRLHPPSRDECAHALGLSRQQLNEAIAVLDSDMDKWRERVPIAIACFESPASGREAARLIAQSDDESQVLALLSGWTPDDSRTILAAATEAEDLAQFRDQLHLRFREFNDALIALGREPLIDIEAHRLAFDYYLESRREEILLQLRRAFTADFLDGAGLTRYVDLRQLPGLICDDDWLLDYQIPPERLMEAQIGAWLSTHEIQTATVEQPLESILELRTTNRKVLVTAGNNAGVLVRAWCEKAGVECPELWLGDGCGGRLADWADRQGLLDFIELSDISILLRHIDRERLWPNGMPLTINRDQLTLSPDDVERGLSAQEQQSAAQRLQRSTIMLGSRRFGTSPGDFAEIAEAVRETLSPELVDAPFRIDLGAAPTVGRRSAASNGSGSSYYSRPVSFTEGQRAVIGLAAEVAAIEWLKSQKPYEGAILRWVSGYKEKVEGGSDGDDTLGYDIEVVTKARKYLFEVKGTADDNTEFEMSENEVNVARRNTSRDAYRIIFVRYVLDPDRMRPMLLPNPFSQRGTDAYRVVGRGLRYRFSPSPTSN